MDTLPVFFGSFGACLLGPKTTKSANAGRIAFGLFDALTTFPNGYGWQQKDGNGDWQFAAQPQITQGTICKRIGGGTTYWQAQQTITQLAADVDPLSTLHTALSGDARFWLPISAVPEGQINLLYLAPDYPSDRLDWSPDQWTLTQLSDADWAQIPDHAQYSAPWITPFRSLGANRPVSPQTSNGYAWIACPNFDYRFPVWAMPLSIPAADPFANRTLAWHPGPQNTSDQQPPPPHNVWHPHGYLSPIYPPPLPQALDGYSNRKYQSFETAKAGEIIVDGYQGLGRATHYLVLQDCAVADFYDGLANHPALLRKINPNYFLNFNPNSAPQSVDLPDRVACSTTLAAQITLTQCAEPDWVYFLDPNDPENPNATYRLKLDSPGPPVTAPIVLSQDGGEKTAELQYQLHRPWQQPKANSLSGIPDFYAQTFENQFSVPSWNPSLRYQHWNSDDETWEDVSSFPPITFQAFSVAFTFGNTDPGTGHPLPLPLPPSLGPADDQWYLTTTTVSATQTIFVSEYYAQVGNAAFTMAFHNNVSGNDEVLCLLGTPLFAKLTRTETFSLAGDLHAELGNDLEAKLDAIQFPPRSHYQRPVAYQPKPDGSFNLVLGDLPADHSPEETWSGHPAFTLATFVITASKTELSP